MQSDSVAITGSPLNAGKMTFKKGGGQMELSILPTTKVTL
jgi:hypothetical protein